MTKLIIVDYLEKTGIPGLDDPYEKKNGLYVAQGDAKATRSLSLITSGISNCSALILKNINTGDAMLLHLDQNSVFGDIDGRLMNIYITTFLDMPGEKKGVIVNGEHSFDREGLKAMFEKWGVEFVPSINVPSGKFHLSLVFDLKSAEISCKLTEKKQIATYILDEFKTIENTSVIKGDTKSLAQLIEEKKAWLMQQEEICNQWKVLEKNNDFDVSLDFGLKNIDFLEPVDIYSLIQSALDYDNEDEKKSNEQLHTIINTLATFSDGHHDYNSRLKFIRLYLPLMKYIINRDKTEPTNLQITKYLIDNIKNSKISQRMEIQYPTLLNVFNKSYNLLCELNDQAAILATKNPEEASLKERYQDMRKSSTNPDNESEEKFPTLKK